MSDLPYIKQCDPHAGYHAWWVEIDSAVIQALQKERYLLGNELELFEQEFSSWQESTHTIGVANGTDALILSLAALDIPPGGAVLTPSFTAVATVNAIVRSGAVPVYIDVNPETGTLCPQSVERTLKRLTKPLSPLKPAALMVVHLYGFPAEMSRLCALAEEYSIPIIEDCAQAHGARYRKKRVGTFGKLAAFSFYPTKNIAALGDAGAVVTDDIELAERIRSLRQYGWNDRRESHEIGMNSRLDELQAVILRIKLRHINNETRRRRKIARLYSQGMTSPGLRPLTPLPETEPVWHQYVLRTSDRASFRAYLEEHKIQTGIHYPQAVHQHPAYAAGYADLREQRLIEPLIATEELTGEVVSLPMYPQLDDPTVDRVIEACREWSLHSKGGTDG